MSNILIYRTLQVPTPHRVFVERVDYIVGYCVGNSFRIVSVFDNPSDALERRDALMDHRKEQIVILENRTQLLYYV